MSITLKILGRDWAVENNQSEPETWNRGQRAVWTSNKQDERNFSESTFLVYAVIWLKTWSKCDA
jgi:hypothetical protein